MTLGNLTTSEIEKRMGVAIPADTLAFMNSSHQDRAENISNGKWHCFDIPFVLVCGDMDTAQKIYDGIKHLSGDIKQQLQIAIQD